MIIWMQGFSALRAGSRRLPLCRPHFPSAGPLAHQLSTFSKPTFTQISGGSAGKNVSVSLIFRRNMAGKRTFVIHPSRFVWRRFKSSLHFFTMLGVIPLTAVTVYANVFIGEADLAEIPEGYYPKEYEYYKNPVTRWMQKNIFPPPQKGYEQMMHVMDEALERARLTRLGNKITALQAERRDYEGYLHNPGMTSKYQDQWHDRANHYHDEIDDALRPMK